MGLFLAINMVKRTGVTSHWCVYHVNWFSRPPVLGNRKAGGLFNYFHTTTQRYINDIVKCWKWVVFPWQTFHYSFIHWEYSGEQSTPASTLPHSHTNGGIKLCLPTHWRQCGVQCLAQGHFDMWTGGAGIQTADLSIIGRPALPPELTSLTSHVSIYGHKRDNDWQRSPYMGISACMTADFWMEVRDCL